MPASFAEAKNVSDGRPNDMDASYTKVIVVCFLTAICSGCFMYAWKNYFQERKLAAMKQSPGAISSKV